MRESLVAAEAVATVVEENLSDHPRFWNYLFRPRGVAQLTGFEVTPEGSGAGRLRFSDALAITPALPVALFFSLPPCFPEGSSSLPGSARPWRSASEGRSDKMRFETKICIDKGRRFGFNTKSDVLYAHVGPRRLNVMLSFVIRLAILASRVGARRVAQ